MVSMGDAVSGKSYVYRLSSPIWHSVSVRSEYAAIHEVTNGPFRAEEDEFAEWPWPSRKRSARSPRRPNNPKEAGLHGGEFAAQTGGRDCLAGRCGCCPGLCQDPMSWLPLIAINAVSLPVATESLSSTVVRGPSAKIPVPPLFTVAERSMMTKVGALSRLDVIKMPSAPFVETILSRIRTSAPL
jgi:hypothetical protein